MGFFEKNTQQKQNMTAEQESFESVEKSFSEAFSTNVSLLKGFFIFIKFSVYSTFSAERT